MTNKIWFFYTKYLDLFHPFRKVEKKIEVAAVVISCMCVCMHTS